jgi:hypothetical protein
MPKITYCNHLSIDSLSVSGTLKPAAQLHKAYIKNQARNGIYLAPNLSKKRQVIARIAN